MLRGLVIVVMAIDHVRDFFNYGGEADPMANPAIGAALFFTRWITHFCAPVFVFLAGTSAGLMTGVQFLGRRACVVMGAAIVLGHNLLDSIWTVTKGVFDTSHPWWVGLHAQMAVPAGPFFFAVAYPVLPWVGVMLLAFGTASLFQQPARRADRGDARVVAWGMAATAAFVVLRGIGIYGEPNPWQLQARAISTLIDFVNVTKYPPSLLYTLMTLGPAAILCAYASRIPDSIKRPLIVFGRAPFAFYVAHLYLIHGLAVIFGVLQGFRAREFFTYSFFFPKGYGTGLPGVYAVWVLVVAALYPLCQWVAAVKSRRHDWWLSYL